NRGICIPITYTAMGTPTEKIVIEALSGFCDWDDANGMTTQGTGDRKDHFARCRCKQGIVFAAFDIFPRMNLSTALSDQNVARQHNLTTIFFNPQAFGMGVAAITCTAASFLMCHGKVLRLLF